MRDETRAETARLWRQNRIRQGICISCDRKRGRSTSKSRCAKCLERYRLLMRKRREEQE
jgi:hypothetical protein